MVVKESVKRMIAILNETERAALELRFAAFHLGTACSEKNRSRSRIDKAESLLDRAEKRFDECLRLARKTIAEDLPNGGKE